MRKVLAALLCLGGRAEEIFTAPVDEVPAEVAPFDIGAPEPTATPEPTVP